MENYKIKFDMTSNVMQVGIYLFNREIERFQHMNITFDTGASRTIISKDILYLLGYEVSDCEKTRIVTASGVEFVDKVIVEKIKIGNCVLENIEVYAHTFPEASFSLGVIGLNIISQFNWNMDFYNRELRFEKHPNTEIING
ncbi:MAG: retropepsin-like aspartic protease [Cellulosilyticaceae bacterium]